MTIVAENVEYDGVLVRHKGYATTFDFRRGARFPGAVRVLYRHYGGMIDEINEDEYI